MNSEKNMETAEKLEYIKTYDPLGAEKLKRLLERKETLKTGNVYGERFTDRQFFLMFEPLLAGAFEKARILEALISGEKTISDLAQKLGLAPDIVFRHLKDMMKGNLVEIVGYRERDGLFRKKVD
jgi:DNA-binding transcriptional ArsR family regulator